MPTVEIELPYNWEPRDYQREAWQELEAGCKRMLLFWHRRAGKDLFAINWIASQALQRVGAYWHVFPTYRQGRKIAWEGSTKDGRAFRSHFPREIIQRKRDAELTLDFINGSQYVVVGADNPDSQVGTNPVGIVFSEWAVMKDPSIWRYLQPILIENDGWALFITTPRGRNHAYRMKQKWEKESSGFVQVLGRKDTGAVTDAQIELAKSEGFSDEMVAQEFDCSFDAALKDAWFGQEMKAASDEGRIGHVPFDPRVQVETWWDLGFNDHTVIWFAQPSFGQIRIIGCKWGTGQSLAHYAQILSDFRDAHPGLVYRRHILPWDGGTANVQTGKTNKQTLKELGVYNIKVLRKVDVMRGINATRLMLPRCWFDEDSCGQGIEGLRQYVRKAIDGAEDPDGNPVYGNDPVHNWASHFADAFRTGALGSKPDEVPNPGHEAPYAPMSIA